MRAVGLIPARLHSTRLPEKLLLDATGRPLLQYAWEAACQVKALEEVIIATDSPRIAEVARRFGARCEMTGDHPSGTDRIAEVARRCCSDADVLVNIQGDEPELDPQSLETLIGLLAANSSAEMATLGSPIACRRDLDDPACVKVVCAADGRALYFSRAAIPHCRDADPDELLASADPPWLLHLGVYAYRRDFLLRLTELPPSRLERLEKLEQLRALEAGAVIQVGVVTHRAAGIDTPDDYRRFVERRRAA